ncbi:hypothetical protein WA026_001447 [Henosepilachna vigintioctopunctata]|uniref:Alpha 1,4-glycosyltransferase domain-containing protein n=1 Tax=Henosepilachna vigintioctopunctata TaxID=420089 RepID=A0AAW1UTF0_9CUCU
MSYLVRPWLSALRNQYVIVVLLFFTISWTYVYYNPSYLMIPTRTSNHSLKNVKSIECYKVGKETLPDISTVDIRKGKSIFFHETSCNSYINDKIVINSRQACAVESAALMNPNLDVYLTFTSPGVFKFEDTESDRFLKALLGYSNVRINHLNYEKYTKGTPVEELYSKGAIEASHYAMSHASDILRYLTLWKYGGIYLDLDVVVIKNLESLPPNFSGCQWRNQVAAGILGFEPIGAEGHKLATECLMDLKEKFNGTIWGHNGPGVVTRMAKKHCQVEKHNITDLCNRTCDNFHIFSTEWFYPIPWRSWKQFFQEKDTGEVMTATENSYIIHVWNKFSVLTKLPIQSLSAYATFAKKYCPKVFQQCDIFF